MIALLLATALTFSGPDSTEVYMYRTLLLRAAPGSLLEVIDRYRERAPAYKAAGESTPLIMRHSQGDQWDLLLLFPMESFEAYYSAERVARRREARFDETEFEERLGPHVAWREETFVLGPPLETVERKFEQSGYYHVEMFIAVPGKRAELLEQRRMENAFYSELGRPGNLIFTRVAGGAWDMYTVGFYKDIKDFAALSDISDERQEAAAIAAGFEGSGSIGTYLRTLMASHHDTLARRVR